MTEDNTVSQAAEKLASIPATEQNRSEAPPESSQEEPGTERPAGETQEAEQAQPAIDPPASWSKDDKAFFESLPPEVKQVIASRESERESAVNRRLQEAAEKSKAAEAAREQAVSNAQQHVQQLQNLAQALHQQLQSEFPEVQSTNDLAKLANEDPARFLQWQARQMVLQQAGHAITAQRQQQEMLQQQKNRAWEAEQEKILVDLVPEWKDKGKKDADLQAIRQHAISVGIPEGQAAQPWAAAAVIMAKESMEYRRDKKAALQKRVINLPKVVKPGTAPEPGEADRTRAEEARKRLSKTGSIDDAVAALSARRRA